MNNADFWGILQIYYSISFELSEAFHIFSDGIKSGFVWLRGGKSILIISYNSSASLIHASNASPTTATVHISQRAALVFGLFHPSGIPDSCIIILECSKKKKTTKANQPGVASAASFELWGFLSHGVTLPCHCPTWLCSQWSCSCALFFFGLHVIDSHDKNQALCLSSMWLIECILYRRLDNTHTHMLSSSPYGRTLF